MPGARRRSWASTSIDYAQADLLELGSIGRQFDVIASVGVLHHLADPFAGWRVLLSLLRPGGFMNLGFYSELARRHIVKARSFVAAHGSSATADEIRRRRQDVLDQRADFGKTVDLLDFYSMSTCRDLLFHAQEHRMTLAGIAAFLRDNGLTFLGFEIDGNVLHAYRRRFANDPAATDLAQWQAFETDNPDIFIGMYQFWISEGGVRRQAENCVSDCIWPLCVFFGNGCGRCKFSRNQSLFSSGHKDCADQSISVTNRSRGRDNGYLLARDRSALSRGESARFRTRVPEHDKACSGCRQTFAGAASGLEFLLCYGGVASGRHIYPESLRNFGACASRCRRHDRGDGGPETSERRQRQGHE